ncbi:MAG: hypothetical protein ACOC2U_01645 [bacterium]
MLLVELDDGKIYQVVAKQKHTMDAVFSVTEKHDSLLLLKEPIEGIEFEETKGERS